MSMVLNLISLTYHIERDGERWHHGTRQVSMNRGFLSRVMKLGSMVGSERFL